MCIFELNGVTDLSHDEMLHSNKTSSSLKTMSIKGARKIMRILPYFDFEDDEALFDF